MQRQLTVESETNLIPVPETPIKMNQYQSP